MFLNPITWPEGKKCAACITFDIDGDTLVRVGRPHDADLRLQPISAGRYGPTVAVPRILETYRRLELSQTFLCLARLWSTITKP